MRALALAFVRPSNIPVRRAFEGPKELISWCVIRRTSQAPVPRK
jgi:hypothetical protein